MDGHILSHRWLNWSATISPSGKVYSIDWIMAQSDGPHIEEEGSPQMISLKSDISGNHLDNGEVGPSIRRKRRKKREPRPESIIVYRSEMEKSPEEDQGVEEGVERSTEEGDKFLFTPTGEGRTWEILLKACSDMPSLNVCVALALKCCFSTLYGKILASPFVIFILNASLLIGGWNLPPDSRYVTLTGTITRGKKKGQLVDIHLTMTEKELRDLAKSRERLDAECEAGQASKRKCSLGVAQGPHVVLWSISCVPMVFLLSFITSFYYGTLTWYNVFLVYNEERTFWHKITICPFLIIFYPVLIMPVALSLALYSAVVQVSWAFSEWWQAVRDLEKGFCGWACGKMGLEDCSPYSVVELLDSDTVSGTLQSKAPSEFAQTSSVWGVVRWEEHVEGAVLQAEVKLM